MARRRGAVELAVGREIRTLPVEIQRRGLVSVAIVLAREVDALEFGNSPGSSRDLAAVTRELRATLAELAQFQSVEAKDGDAVDDLQRRREARRTTG